jgi:hypothetical protein
MISVLLLAGAAAVLPTGAGARDAPRCRVGQLTVSLRPGSPGAGQRYAVVTLRNHSHRTCRIFGYAGLQLLGGRLQALPTRVTRDRSRAPRTQTVAPGRRTPALLHWTVIATDGEPQSGRCEPTPRWVEVTPPDAFRHLTIRWRQGAVCDHGRIDLTPFGSTMP